MANKTCSLSYVVNAILILGFLGHCHGSSSPHYFFSRKDFPAGFVFGAASAAYQYEGAAHEGGRGPSIWDTFAEKHPVDFNGQVILRSAIFGVTEKISDHSTGKVALDFYHRYKEDIQNLKELNMDAFRFSISWPRILPTGKISGGVNPEGVTFYNNVINDLLANGLKPFVTLFHWDLPQPLQDEYGGFLSHKVVDDYLAYVDFCFKTFGDRVKHWITLNEPISVSWYGYATGIHAPGRCSDYIGDCTAGNSATEPYIVAHNQLLAHAAAVKLYRENYKSSQKGEIGVTFASHWFVPKSMTVAGVKAQRRGLDFMLGWFLHPITYGDYPPSMRTIVGKRLPKFTAAESKMLVGSIDFLGMNYYTSYYASFSATHNTVNLSYTTDSGVDFTAEKNGVYIGTPTATAWQYVYPKGIYSLMMYIKNYYKNPTIYITENGVAEANNNSLSVEEALKDNLRLVYHYGHLTYLWKAIKGGADVRGYFVWSFLDDFEWDAGYTIRFGLNYIDFKNNLKRYRKHSALWFQKFLHKG